MQSEGWAFIFQRVRTKISEIDLIFEKENEIKLIEVKTLDQAWRSFQRINQRQVDKLLQNQLHLNQVYKNKIFSAEICWVMPTSLHFVVLSE
jgi:Holliday junction resolvase-like predicted endonuclease